MSPYLQHIDLNNIIVNLVDYSVMSSDMSRPGDCITAF